MICVAKSENHTATKDTCFLELLRKGIAVGDEMDHQVRQGEAEFSVQQFLTNAKSQEMKTVAKKIADNNNQLNEYYQALNLLLRLKVPVAHE